MGLVMVVCLLLVVIVYVYYFMVIMVKLFGDRVGFCDILVDWCKNVIVFGFGVGVGKDI